MKESKRVVIFFFLWFIYAFVIDKKKVTLGQSQYKTSTVTTCTYVSALFTQMWHLQPPQTPPLPSSVTNNVTLSIADQSSRSVLLNLLTSEDPH